MAKVLIDISGHKGLGGSWYGFTDQTTATPNMVFDSADGELVGGYFNPFLRPGFLSPASATTASVSVDQALASVVGSAIYDQVNADYYVAERGRQIYKGDTFEDTSIERVKQLASTGVAQDLEIYQLNGKRKLFYIFTTTGTITYTATWTGGSQGYRYILTSVNPSTGSVPPALAANTRTTSASGATLTGSVVVSAGTDRVLVVYAWNYTLNAATGATFGGVAMTASDSSTGTTGGQAMSATVFYLVNPAVSTANVVVSWAGSETNLGFQSFVYTGASQTTPTSAVGSGTGNDTGLTTSPAVSLGKVLLLNGMLETTTVTVTSGDTIYNAANTLGNDLALSGTASTYSLKGGSSDLPFANSDDAWLTSTASGAFSAQTNSLYNFMRVADNTYAYLFAGSQVHKVDGTSLTGGTNGTVVQSVLVFPATFTIVDALDFGGSMYIAIHQNIIQTSAVEPSALNLNSPCGVYIWDRQTTQVLMDSYVAIDGVQSISKIYVAPNGEMRMICTNSQGIAEVRRFNGTTFEVLKPVGLGGAPVFPDSVVSTGQLTVWLGSNGDMMAHGVVKPGGAEVLARIGNFVTRATIPQATMTPGALLFGSSGGFTAATGYRTDRQQFVISYAPGGTSPVIKQFFPFDLGTINSNNQLSLQGNAYTAVNFLPQLGKINFIHVYHNKTTTSGSTVQGTLSMYLNQSTSAVADISITKDDIARGWKYQAIGQSTDKNAVFGVQFKVAWPTDQAMTDTVNWLPRVIEIDYDLIEKKK